MANPIYKALGGGMPKGMNFAQMMGQYQKFRKEFQGDPQQEVQKLLQSGKISQDQLNQAQAIAQQFQGLFH